MNFIHILKKVWGGGNRRESEEVKLQISQHEFCGNYRKIRVENVHRGKRREGEKSDTRKYGNGGGTEG